MGESGSGKSTLLHLIAGLDEADDGEIWLNRVLVTALSDFNRAALRRETLGTSGTRRLLGYPRADAGSQSVRREPSRWANFVMWRRGHESAAL